MAWRGKARLGAAGLGSARHGKVWQGHQLHRKEAMKFADWLMSGRFHRNRDWILNIAWIALTALAIGLVLGAEVTR